MAKTLFYRLFGRGKIDAPLRLELEQEGILLEDEGVGGSITYHNFRAPGRVSSLRRVWFTGAVAVTKARLLALSDGSPAINVPLADERLRAMRFTIEGSDTLCVAFDAALFHSDWSGMIEYRFRTAQAQRCLALVQQTGVS